MKWLYAETILDWESFFFNKFKLASEASVENPHYYSKDCLFKY